MVRRKANDPNNRAVVAICRRGGLYESAASCAAGIDNNCDGLAGAADPYCLPYLSPP